jgi:hypothetical protein
MYPGNKNMKLIGSKLAMHLFKCSKSIYLPVLIVMIHGFSSKIAIEGESTLHFFIVNFICHSL